MKNVNLSETALIYIIINKLKRISEGKNKNG
jgi:hypothetical protein